MKLGCVLLAAGSGTRFGGDKLLHRIDGVPMVERACMLHAGVDYDARILVMRPGDEAVQSIAARYGFSTVVNERALDGIGTSAAAGAAALRMRNEPLDGALFAVCDQPYLTHATVSALMRRFCEAPHAIVAPVCNGKRGNPVIFPGELLGEFAWLSGDVGGSAIIRAHRELLTSVAVEDPSELFDVDYQLEESRNRL